MIWWFSDLSRDEVMIVVNDDRALLATTHGRAPEHRLALLATTLTSNKSKSADCARWMRHNLTAEIPSADFSPESASLFTPPAIICICIIKRVIKTLSQANRFVKT
jgi:hypothetical protein